VVPYGETIGGIDGHWSVRPNPLGLELDYQQPPRLPEWSSPVDNVPPGDDLGTSSLLRCHEKQVEPEPALRFFFC